MRTAELTQNNYYHTYHQAWCTAIQLGKVGLASAVTGAALETLLRTYQIPVLPSLAALVAGGIVVGKCCGWKFASDMRSSVKRPQMKAMGTAKSFAPWIGAVMTPVAAICTQHLTPLLSL